MGLEIPHDVVFELFDIERLFLYLEPINEYTEYLLVEIWIRPTITYGLVACFVTESET